VKLSLNVKINQRFIEIYLNSPLTIDFLNDVAHGGTMNILNLKILNNLPVPIPPIEEQAQIVAKVYQLMALCDKLEAGAGADRWREIDGGYFASSAGGVVWEFLRALARVRTISAPIPQNRNYCKA